MKQQRRNGSLPTIEDMFQKQRKWTNSDDRSKLKDKLIIEMIVTDNQPFTMVSDIGFKCLVTAAEPRYALKREKYKYQLQISVIGLLDY